MQLWQACIAHCGIEFALRLQQKTLQILDSTGLKKSASYMIKKFNTLRNIDFLGLG